MCSCLISDPSLDKSEIMSFDHKAVPGHCQLLHLALWYWLKYSNNFLFSLSLSTFFLIPPTHSLHSLQTLHRVVNTQYIISQDCRVLNGRRINCGWPLYSGKGVVYQRPVSTQWRGDYFCLREGLYCLPWKRGCHSGKLSHCHAGSWD